MKEDIDTIVNTLQDRMIQEYLDPQNGFRAKSKSNSKYTPKKKKRKKKK